MNDTARGRQARQRLIDKRLRRTSLRKILRIVRLLRIHDRIIERLDKGILTFSGYTRHKLINLRPIDLSKEALRVVLALYRQCQAILGRGLERHRSCQKIVLCNQYGLGKRHTAYQINGNLGQTGLGIPIGRHPIGLVSLILALIKDSAQTDKRSRQGSRLTDLQRILIGQLATHLRKNIQENNLGTAGHGIRVRRDFSRHASHCSIKIWHLSIGTNGLIIKGLDVDGTQS